MEVEKNISAESEGWKLGVFQFLFISMGQGDCCLITCPDGRHVMVDCGTKAGEKEGHQMYQVAKDLRSNDQLGSNLTYKNKLEALILTHPDVDHISKVQELLAAAKAGFQYFDPPQKTGSKKVRPIKKRSPSDPYNASTPTPIGESFDTIAVEKVFFSDFNRAMPGLKNQPLKLYSQTGSNDCGGIIYDKLKPKELACVAINATEKVLHTWKEPYNAANYEKKDILSLEKCVVVCEGTHDNKNWSVKIIAGGVAKGVGDDDPGDTEGRNAGSLVTFIEYGDDRILICGDATLSTQRFVLNSTFKEKLKDLSLIQVPHHGSDVTQFYEPLVQHCKPKRAVISVQKYEHSHHLPGKTSIERAELHAEAVTEGFTICYWQKKTRAELETEKALWGTADYKYKVEKSSQNHPARWVRQGNYSEEFTGEGVVMLDDLHNISVTTHFLIQKKTKKNVQQTSMQGHIWFYFDGSGT